MLTKTQGLDIAKLGQQKRFVFVDGLTGAFTPAPYHSGTSGRRQDTVMSLRVGSAASPGLPSPKRAPEALRHQNQGDGSAKPTEQRQDDDTPDNDGPPIPQEKDSRYMLSSTALPHLSKTVTEAIQATTGTPDDSGTSRSRRVLLVLDQPDVLLSIDPSLSTLGLLSAISALSQSAYATIAAVGADSPLIAAASAELGVSEGAPLVFSPLESNHAAFVTALTHRARHVLQLRKLESGWASDVSGVLRVSPGGAWEFEEEGLSGAEELEEQEKELLYYVKGDGNVRVFERGAGAVG